MHSSLRIQMHGNHWLQDYRETGVGIRRSFAHIAINNTPLLVGIPPAREGRLRYTSGVRLFLLKSRERPSVGFLGVQGRRVSGECRTYRDQNRATEKSLSHNCTAFSGL